MCSKISSFIILFVIVLSGCATQHMQDLHAVIIDRGYPADYADGYTDGCSSGYSAAGNPYYGFKKEVNREGKYKEGWNDGFTVCKSKYDSIGRAIGPAL